MANKEAAEQLNFNADLCKQAAHHLDFLKEVDRVPELKQSDTLRRAVYRYEMFWLPLAADHPKECLVAPLDIEWVWHCHMLNPEAYERDCHTIVGDTVNHTLYGRTQFHVKQEESRKFWLQKYESKDEPFDIDFTTPNNQKQDENFNSKLTYDIVAAAERQMVFYYQVSLPHYRDSKFLEQSLLRYKQFLFIKTQIEQDFLVPCYDIDLIWHTHQLNPLVYKADMMKIIGHLFNHDDNVNDRSEGSKLYKAGNETSANWNTFYDESFSLFGAMYRGKPPTGLLHDTGSISFNLDKEYASDTKTCVITLEKLTVTLPPGNSHMYRTCKLIGASTNGNSTVEKWFTLKHRVKSSSKGILDWTYVGYYQFDTKLASGIRFDLHCQTGRVCCKSETFIGSHTMNIKSVLHNRANGNRRGPINAKVALGNNITLDIEGSFSKPECRNLEAKMLLRGKAVLCLEKGYYQTVMIPDDLQKLFGPVALEKRPKSASSQCKAATHRQPLIMSVIQVNHNDKMAAIAHLIASDQLPLPTQVDECGVTLNPKKGERAVLIKNNKGDWGILLGCWEGFKRGVAGTYSEKGVYGSPGTLSIKFYKFSTKKISTLLLRYQSYYTFELESSEVDLRCGVIRIDERCKEVAENIAMAFSVSLLHVLCIPRPEGWQESQAVQPADELRGDKSLYIIPSDDMEFITASGLQCSTPSNYYMSSNYGNKMCTMCDGNAIKYEGNWGDLPGEDDADPNSNGCGCGNSNKKNEKDFKAGIVGAGCGGCGGHAYLSEYGGRSYGTGKGAYVGAYKGRSAVRTHTARGNTGTDTGWGSSTAFPVNFDAAFSVCDINTDSDRGGCGGGCGGSGCGGGGGGCGGGCD